ncbi:hypothetical protein FSST1_006770 [Fusarium sambucinum]
MPSFYDSDFSSYHVPRSSTRTQNGNPDPSIVWMLEKLHINPDGDGTLSPPGYRQAPKFGPLESHVRQPLELHVELHDEDHRTAKSSPPFTMKESFLHGRSQWIDEPVITKWREPSKELSEVLAQADQLYHQWSLSKPSPFDPFFDKLWMETADILRDVGLPWHNNNLNMPDETDSSWPFHFKTFERVAILSKGKRVQDPDASGYITNWSEGNYYGIRALKQELYSHYPKQEPVLLIDHLESEIAKAASHIFGLEWHRVSLKDSNTLMDTVRRLTSNGERPIIFAATLANTTGEVDDISIIDKISRNFSLLLHLDASRVFDFLTTVGEDFRRLLGIPRLRLHHAKHGERGCFVNGEIMASTIVAGGSNAYVHPPPVVALKPKLLGNQTPTRVEYIRGTDGTLSGSRDSIGPLMLCLQELRFGNRGFQEIYESCFIRRMRLMNELKSLDIHFHAPSTSLDLIIRVPAGRSSDLVDLGAKAVRGDRYLLTMQPSINGENIRSLLRVLGSHDELLLSKAAVQIELQSPTSRYRLPDGVIEKVWQTVQSFKIAARYSCGYPLNQAPYSALGPVIGHFLGVRIPEEWARCEASKILQQRKQALGLLTEKSQESFNACFTTGSTMGNRIGLHTGLIQYPNAFVYFSSATHYSVKKTVKDCDTWTRRWMPGRVPRFAEIPADAYGRMIPNALKQQVLSDKAECDAHQEQYQMILFANRGTTFVGGQDDIVELTQTLAQIEVVPSYIHVDGALDLGFIADGLRLGPPGAQGPNSKTPVVQGITLSHHKVFGIMVSGEVISYCPNHCKQFDALAGTVDPRAVLETWLFEKTYATADLVTIWNYCLGNARMLRELLAEHKVPTHFNQDSIITLLEYPPRWLVQEFHLAPEGDWVHFITMPHICPTTIRRFVRAVAAIDTNCGTAFDYVGHSLASSLHLSGRTQLRRLTSRNTYSENVLAVANLAILQNMQAQSVRDDLGLRKLYDIRSRFIYSAMSFAAFNDMNEPLVVFLADGTGDRVLKPSLMLVRYCFHDRLHMLHDIAIQLFGHVGDLVGVDVVTDAWSFRPVFF